MNKKVKIGIVLLITTVLAGFFGWFNSSNSKTDVLTFYGNIDIRQVSLAFDGSGRITELLVEEGQSVKKGQVLAKLDNRMLLLQITEIKAAIAAQEQVVLRLKNGPRQQEIAQAKAHLNAAIAEEKLTSQNYQRFADLAQSNAASKQVRDEAHAAKLIAYAKLTNAKLALELLQLGTRIEDIAKAEADLQKLQANLAIFEHNLNLGDLIAPNDAVVRTRLLEVGDMASPQKAVFTLALTSPKWVRAYVSEAQLGRLKLGDKAHIISDSFPNQTFAANLSYIASVAEFTPKTVQTPELRSSLVYEVRLQIEDKNEQLHLGMPVTVRF